MIHQSTKPLKAVALVSAMTMICICPSRAGPYYDLWIGEDFRTTIYSTASHGQAEMSEQSADANAPESNVRTVGGIFNRLRGCWVPPSASQARRGMEITVRFAFKRNGQILAEPRVTYISAGASADTRAAYVDAVTAALNRCTPMNFSKGLAAVVVGHPFAIRFVDNRSGLPQ